MENEKTRGSGPQIPEIIAIVCNCMVPAPFPRHLSSEVSRKPTIVRFYRFPALGARSLAIVCNWVVSGSIVILLALTVFIGEPSVAQWLSPSS